MPTKSNEPRRIVFPFLAAALALAGCGGPDAPGGAGGQMPPMDVVVEEITAAPTPNLIVLSGRVEAGRSVQVRARADGILERRLFVEGSRVEEGEALFEIDQRDLVSRRQQAQAAVAAATAARNNARSVFNRISVLLPRNAVSTQEFETAQANLQQAEAAMLEADAALDRARLQLDHATVRAPISGRIGRSQVSEGALVNAASATLLAQIDQLDPVNVVFNPSASMVSDIRHQVESGQLELADVRSLPVTILQPDGRPGAMTGTVDFADAAIDPGTGSQGFRARFDNPGGQLLPGEFVRASIEAGIKRSGVSVPERAVSIGADSASVLVVGEGNAVRQQPLVLGGQSGGRWLVQDGIKPGERIIVDGWHKVRVGQVVNPVASPAAAAAEAVEEEERAQ